jgi:hypothetical protein
MPWSPSFEKAQPDPRLDRFRGRAAVATRYGEPAGHLLVETDYLSEKLSGALWWRRWATPVEYAQVHTLLDGTPGTTWVMPADIGDTVAEWAAGTHTERGTTYGLTWLDQAGSDHVHRDVFGHQH